MACYHPITGYRSRVVNASGRRSIVFNPSAGYVDMPVTVPCGQCIGCRLERSRQWAIRCMHEASLHEDNCFITLTYNDAHLPAHNSLVVSDFQKFMKRLRKRFGHKTIRYYHCGEYGERHGRPHYHACLFGFDFPDKELFKTENGNRLYTSVIANELWPMGFVILGAVTFDSAAYVARYIMKKVTGKNAAEHYLSVDADTGEIFERKPEYVTMSRRPGIGKGWYDKYKTDIFPTDEVIVRGKKMRVPRYYSNQYEIENPDEYKKIYLNRLTKAKALCKDATYDRLQVRETCQKARMMLLIRKLEKEI